ncbi:threonine ammonia-lyase [Paratractidigestivibacter sp.]|uniref:threonine ammonia-lyase n=1 Tax=Paratractidigestivibacter sp. TaxID=2847316 RepID=UPI002ABE49B2|nr:threonine ammonia-lyase [Paratractidigestivibacter sp.]
MADMLTLEAFEEASEKVKEVTLETKLVESPYLCAATGNRVWLKPENMQRTGAYKLRGAYYKISKLSQDELDRGVITASAGNHAQGVAYAATHAGARSIVVMPTTTPLIKVERTKGYGAEVILHGDVFDEAGEYAQKLAEEQGLTYIPPFNDETVATGQGTIGMEIVQELPLVDTILVPVGGGGLSCGIATFAKLYNPKIRVIGVEPAGAPSLTAALEAGHAVKLPSANTIADGTAVLEVGDKVLPYLKENLDDVLLVEDDELVVSFLDMVENHKMIVENSGLLSVAAAKQLPADGRRVACVLSGGNMDVITMSSVVQYGLIQRSRVFTVSVLLPDRPGSLVRVASVIAEHNGNVIKLKHNQFVTTNRNAAVELRVTIEAYGPEHRQEIIDALSEAGFNPELPSFREAN